MSFDLYESPCSFSHEGDLQEAGFASFSSLEQHELLGEFFLEAELEEEEGGLNG